MDYRIIRIILLLVTLLCAADGRGCSREAFEYKKSKTAIRKDRKRMTKMQRLLGLYHVAPTHAPFHTKLFRIYRLCNYVTGAVGMVIILLVPSCGILVLILKYILCDLPMDIYTAALTNWGNGPRTLRFEKAKRP